MVAGLQTLPLASIHVIGRRAEALNGFLMDLQHDNALQGMDDQDPALQARIEALIWW